MSLKATATRILTTLGTTVTVTATDPDTEATVTRTGKGAIVGSGRGSMFGALLGAIVNGNGNGVDVPMTDDQLVVEADLAPVKGARIGYASKDRVVGHVEPVYDRDVIVLFNVWAREG